MLTVFHTHKQAVPLPSPSYHPGSKEIAESYEEEAAGKLKEEIEKALEDVAGQEELEGFIHEGGEGGHTAKESGNKESGGTGDGPYSGEEKREDTDEEGTAAVDQEGAVRKEWACQFCDKKGDAVSGKGAQGAAGSDEKWKYIRWHDTDLSNNEINEILF